MRRQWRTNDLVDLFHSFERGHLPLPRPLSSVEHWTDNISYKLDITWPDSIQEGRTNMQFKIDNNIPAPEELKGVAASELTLSMRETMGNLNVGESFMVSTAVYAIGAIQSRHSTTCQKLKPKTFAQRRQRDSEGKVIGIRIWRLS